jgi:GTP-binding protein EngB required for normal cell division
MQRQSSSFDVTGKTNNGNDILINKICGHDRVTDVIHHGGRGLLINSFRKALLLQLQADPIRGRDEAAWRYIIAPK